MPVRDRRSRLARDAGATRRDILIGIAVAAAIAAITIPIVASVTSSRDLAPVSAAPTSGLTAAAFITEWTAAGYSVTQGSGADADFLIARDATGAEKARLKHTLAAHLTVTTLLETSTAQDVAVAADGTVYLSDARTNAIRALSADGTVRIVAGGDPVGGFADGTSTLARFHGPAGIALDGEGNLYVADTYNHAIRKITANGFVTTIAGTGSPGYADGVDPLFSHPTGIAVGQDGTVYVADTVNFAIRTIAPDGVVRTLAGGRQGHRDGTGANARFAYPQGIALDSAGNIYVADPVDHAVRKVSATGVVTTYAGTRTAGSANGPAATATFTSPTHVTVDPAGNVFVTDSGTHTVRRISAGTVTTYAGTGTAGRANGPAAAASFHSPEGIAVRPDGALVVADSGNALLRLILR